MSFCVGEYAMRDLLLLFLLIFSLVLPDTGMATEDIVFLKNSTHIRILAASCAACHGTNGNAVGDNNKDIETVSLAGLKSSYIAQRLMDFRSGARDSTVMHHHAKGLNLDEINQLADFFSHQKIVKHFSPKPQQLKVGGNE